MSSYALDRCVSGTLTRRKHVVGQPRIVCGARITRPMNNQLTTIENMTAGFLDAVEQYPDDGFTEENFPVQEIGLRYGF